MKRHNTVLKFIAIAAVATACAFFSVLEAEAVSWRYDFDSALRSAESSGEPLMVDFYTDWCGWCKKLDNDTYMDSKVNDLARSFICVKINADSDQNTARKYNVSSYPTILFLNSKGSVIGSLRGYSPPADFARSMEGVLKQYEGSKAKPAAAAGATKKPAEAAKPEPEKKGWFQFDFESFKSKAKNKIEKMKNHNLQLDGILFHPRTPKAIINNKIVAVGDIVEGLKVASIGKKKVEMLLKNGKTFTLRMK